MTRVLVIDDEPSLREMLSDVLAMADYEVDSARNGQEGLEKVRAVRPDLVLLDCSMPVMDGYETLAQMRADPLLVNLPVIMLTVLSGEQNEIRGLKYGVDDYITKPFKSAVLLARVKTVLSRKQNSISANPLTQLAGNAAIKAEAERRFAAGMPFVLVYADLNNFKSFNDKYGFQRGDEIIKHTGAILVRSVKANGGKGDFVGHIGGDDFVVMTDPVSAPAICRGVIQEFDGTIANFYDPEDRTRGYIVALDRSNAVQKFPLMAISLAAVSTANVPTQQYAELAEAAATLKKRAKEAVRSAWVTSWGAS